VRTFGKVVDWPDEGVPTDHFDPADVPRSATRSDFARGKIAVLRVDHGAATAVCYQVSDCRSHAAIVGCSNASAAALARYADRAGTPRVVLAGELPGGHDVRIGARVRPCAGGVAVLQSWRGLRFAVHEEPVVAGRRIAVATGPLNNYLIVHARPEESPAEFSVEDAMALWCEFGFDEAPLLSRLAVVQTAAPRRPAVKFFTCGTREHPSAPLTGLAVLDLAARHLPWLAWTGSRHADTPGGAVPMPMTSVDPDGTAEVHFPEIAVAFDAPFDAATMVA
jgi:hypothetical protein